MHHKQAYRSPPRADNAARHHFCLDSRNAKVVPGGRLSAMAIRGIIFQILGIGLLLLAGWFLFGGLTDPGGGWEIVGPSFAFKVSAVCAVPGAAALLLGIYWVREARSLREFDEAMEANNRSPRNRSQ